MLERALRRLVYSLILSSAIPPLRHRHRHRLLACPLSLRVSVSDRVSRLAIPLVAIQTVCVSANQLTLYKNCRMATSGGYERRSLVIGRDARLDAAAAAAESESCWPVCYACVLSDAPALLLLLMHVVGWLKKTSCTSCRDTRDVTVRATQPQTKLANNTNLNSNNNNFNR